MSTHIALRISLSLLQPVNCIFWPMRMLNWWSQPVNCINLHKHKTPIALLSEPTVYSLYCGLASKGSLFFETPCIYPLKVSQISDIKVNLEFLYFYCKSFRKECNSVKNVHTISLTKNDVNKGIFVITFQIHQCDVLSPISKRT